MIFYENSKIEPEYDQQIKLTLMLSWIKDFRKQKIMNNFYFQVRKMLLVKKINLSKVKANGSQRIDTVLLMTTKQTTTNWII